MCRQAVKILLSLYLSSFYPYTSTYFPATTTNVKYMFTLTLVSTSKIMKYTCIEYAQRIVVKPVKVEHFSVHHKAHKPSPTLGSVELKGHFNSSNCFGFCMQMLQGFKVLLVDYPKLLTKPNVKVVDILKIRIHT